MQNLYGQAKDAARDAGEAAANYAKDAYRQRGETLRDGSQAVAKTVQDNPLGALLIAGGIGFALALMMTRPAAPAAAALALLRLRRRLLILRSAHARKRVSKDEGHGLATWFETPLTRLLTTRVSIIA